ncbi:MAG: DUF2339 domain-containing protein [Bacteroidales bacterium]|nr:DUF2339 domain-containing protein [Bacteroidales bacterium]
MEAVTTLSFLFIIVLFIIVLNLKSFIKSELDGIKYQLNEIKKQLIAPQKLQELKTPVQEEKISETTPDKIQIIADEKPEKEPEKQTVKDIEKVIEQKPIKEPEWKKRIADKYKSKDAKIKKKTDFEKFIGENLMNKVGILILVIALGLGIKYAIGEGWINPVGRILIGLLSGAILIGLAHKLRKNYIAFSSVLIGGGIAVFYFSIAFGYQMYEIFNQTAAFLLMVGITGFAVVLSLGYNRKELAVLAIIGGFATPIMVSSGTGNYKVLFTYIMILDIGMLVLAYYKRWKIVNIVAYASTVILYSLWLFKTFNSEAEIPYLGALLFATGFYIIFFLMNIINNLKEKTKFEASEFIILISNSFFYYAAGLFLLHEFAASYQGIYTIVLAVLNAAFAYPLYKRKDIDRNLVLLLIGLVLTFVSLTAPVQLNGNYITMFWAIETALLLWLSQKSGIRLLKTASFIVVGLMIISLVMDWDKYYFDYNEAALTIILNRVFITGIISIASLFLSLKLLINENNDDFLRKFSLKKYRSFLTILLILLGYFVVLFEIGYQVDAYYDFTRLTDIALAFYSYLYVLAVLLWTGKIEGKSFKNAFTWISVFMLFLYAFAVHYDFKRILEYYLNNTSDTTFVFIHYLTVIFVIALAYFSWKNIYNFDNKDNSLINIFLWINIALSVYILSNELDYLVLYLSKPDIENMYALSSSVHKIGWPILWGIIAFVLMILGMKTKMKMLRLIALSLFFFTLLKLFAVDVWDMSEGGRIAAFISLGIILLVVSFLYQKLKKLIFEEEEEDTIEN